MSDTRARVLDAALACLVRNGYAGTTARAIAQAGGFAPGVINYHFTDLDDPLVAALAHTSAARARRYRTELAGEVLTVLLRGKPLASAVRVRVLASAAVAFYLGVETLTHLDDDRSRPGDFFDQATRLAAVFDRIPRLRRHERRPR